MSIFDDLLDDLPRGASGPLAYARHIAQEDLGKLDEAKGSVAPAIVKIRDSHRALARLLATGVSPGEAAAKTGYSNSRVSILLADPSFQELLAHYRGKVDEVFVDQLKKIELLAMSASNELLERLEEKPEEFSNGQLMALMESGLDRTIAPKKGGAPTLQVNVGNTVNMADDVAKLFGLAQAKVSAPPVVIDQPAQAKVDQAGG